MYDLLVCFRSTFAALRSDVRSHLKSPVLDLSVFSVLVIIGPITVASNELPIRYLL